MTTRPTTTTNSSSNSLTASAARPTRGQREVEAWRRQRDAEYQQARTALDRIYARGGVIPRIRG